jgi:hypothetical protein
MRTCSSIVAHESGAKRSKEAINPPTGGFLRFAKNYDKISP